MARLLCTIEGRSKVEIYDDGHAEILLRSGERAIIDVEDADRCKDRGWYLNSRAIRSTDNEGAMINRFLMNVTDPDMHVRVVDSNILNCRKANLIVTDRCSSISTVNNTIIRYKNYAELVLINNKNNEEVRIKIDLDDIDKIKDMRWTYNTAAIQNNKAGCLHRYIMNASKDEYVIFKNNDKTDCRKANLSVVSKYKKPAASNIVKKPTIPVSNTKNPKGVTDLGNGFFFVSIYNEKTDTLDQVGTFTNKEEANLAYEKRVREICEELAKDAYESLVASLMEQYYE